MKKRKIYLNLSIIGTLLSLTLLFAGCSDSGEETATSEIVSTPEKTTYSVVTETSIPEKSSEATEIPKPSENSTSWTESTHSNEVEPNYDVVFDQTKVLEFNIVINNDDWLAMIADSKEKSTTTKTAVKENDKKNQDNQENKAVTTISTEDSDPIWVTSTITFDDIEWEHVGIRFKGNSSLRSVLSSGNSKFSFKLDFDEFEDEYPEINNQRFYGFKQLNLNNNFSDPSLMHDKVAADLFREFGLAAAQTAFCIVNIDYGEGSQFFGVYTLVEEMDDTGIEEQFGDDSGNLYKPEGKGANFSEGSYNDEEMEKKNNEEEADYSDVMALYEIINSDERKTNYTSWKLNLEEVINIEGFLKWLAANTVIQNWDTYGNSHHNYYLYNVPDTGQLNWIPWDNNEAFVSGKKDKASLSIELDEVSNQWPLIRYIIDDAEYKMIYDGYLKQFVDEVFVPEKMIKSYNEYFEMIKEYAYAERTGYTFIKSDQAFNIAIEELKVHVVRRNTAVQKYLNE